MVRACVVIVYPSKMKILFAMFNVFPFGRTSGIVNIIQIRNISIGGTVIVYSVDVHAEGK